MPNLRIDIANKDLADILRDVERGNLTSDEAWDELLLYDVSDCIGKDR